MPGIEQLMALKSLRVALCGATSLQRLSQLGEGLQSLTVEACMKVKEVTLELPHIQPKSSPQLMSTSIVVV
jgi:hypothetical protein